MRNLAILLLFLAVAAPAAAYSTGPDLEAREDISDYLPQRDQAAVRDSKPFSVGIPVSEPFRMPGQFLFRPTGNVTLGVCYEGEHMGDEDDQTKVTAKGLTLRGSRASASFYGEFYPANSYGFHVGFGVERKWGEFDAVRTANGATPEQLVLSGQYSAIYAGPSFGWTWLWNSGFTLGFDVSKRKRYSNEYDVDVKNVAVTDAEQRAVKNKLMPESTHGMIMLGYSF